MSRIDNLPISLAAALVIHLWYVSWRQDWSVLILQGRLLLNVGLFQSRFWELVLGCRPILLPNNSTFLHAFMTYSKILLATSLLKSSISTSHFICSIHTLGYLPNFPAPVGGKPSLSNPAIPDLDLAREVKLAFLVHYSALQPLAAPTAGFTRWLQPKGYKFCPATSTMRLMLR